MRTDNTHLPWNATHVSSLFTTTPTLYMYEYKERYTQIFQSLVTQIRIREITACAVGNEQ